MAKEGSDPSRGRRRAGRASRALGKRVREFRRSAELTQEELAVGSGLHPTYISSLEGGHRNPTLNVLGALARALKVPLSELVEGLED